MAETKKEPIAHVRLPYHHPEVQKIKPGGRGSMAIERMPEEAENPSPIGTARSQPDVAPLEARFAVHGIKAGGGDADADDVTGVGEEPLKKTPKKGNPIAKLKEKRAASAY